MEEMENNAILMDKLTKLNKLEIKKSKVLAVIFQKTTENMLDQKLQSLESNFKEQAEFYGQKLENYEDFYQNMIQKYKEQLLQMISSYKELYVNVYLELQEAECNQKIAITNLKKCSDIKQKLMEQANINKAEEYHQKVKACLQKKNNYDLIINRCEKDLENCVVHFEKQLNALFGDKSTQISLKEEGAIQKMFQKIRNLWSGKTKFNSYVVEPINVELDMMDSKLPDIVNEIGQKTLTFVAKIKQAKSETNRIFEQMI